MKENRDVQQEKDAKKRVTFGSILYKLFPFVCIAVILYSGARFVPEYLEYKKAKDGYASLTEETIHVPDAGDVVTKTASAPGKATEAEEEPEEEVVITYPDLDIDFEELAKVNSDFVAVIYVPALDIVYPVARSHDNNEYLHRTFYGDRNSAGSIFLEKYSSPDLNDRNSFILGHNMKNGTMFGKLKNFAADKDLCDTDPYIYLYSLDAVRKYRIFSYYQVSTKSELYDTGTDYESDEGYDTFVDKALAASLYEPAELEFDFADRPNILTLSTCWGVGHVYNFVVHGALLGIAYK